MCWCLLLVVVVVSCASMLEASILYPGGFQPSIGPHGLNSYLAVPVHPVAPPAPAPSHEGCALIIQGAGHSSLYDHTHSIFFGGGYAKLSLSLFCDFHFNFLFHFH